VFPREGCVVFLLLYDSTNTFIDKTNRVLANAETVDLELLLDTGRRSPLFGPAAPPVG